MSEAQPLHLFEGFGVELEYMVVADDSLDTRAVVDELLRDAAGTDEWVSDVEFGPIGWSNELVLHVLELKTNGPARSLEGLSDLFHENVVRSNQLLARRGARLLPTGMHPWMDPFAEMRLWPHENSPIYEAFNRIFDCRGHGWANLQSMHVNLPFADDAEFGRLHAAIRLVLPLLPGLAASSPIADGRPTGNLDTRLEVYRHNARRVPAVSGRVIPERAFDRASYDRLVFEPMFADIAPFDPGGVLREEFLNARGAIARFTRNAIEIRVLDVQECPARDLAICALIVAVLKRLVAEDWSPVASQQSVAIEPLERVLLGTIRDAERHEIDDPEYLAHFGVPDGPITVGEFWRRIVDAVCERDVEFASRWGDAAESLTTAGPLARRILSATGATGDRGPISETYRKLAACLAENQPFVLEKGDRSNFGASVQS